MSRRDTKTPLDRLLAWALLLLLALGGPALWLVDALARIETGRAALYESRKLTARFERLAASADALEDALARAQGATGWRPAFLDSATPALAGAQLQRLAAEAAGDHDVSIERLDVQTQMPDMADAVALRISARGGYGDLIAMLAALEGGQPHLMIGALTIEPFKTHGRTRPDEAPQFSAKLTIIGLIAPEEAP